MVESTVLPLIFVQPFLDRINLINFIFLDDHSDVSVKIETLIGDQFFTEKNYSSCNESRLLLSPEVS